MPYKDIENLPDRVKDHLPRHAAEIYLSAFNNAWKQYRDKARREQIAHRVAWSAVKQKYSKDPSGRWLRK